MNFAVLIIIFMSVPLLLQWRVRSQTKGRHLCAILEKDKPLQFKLLKIRKDDFISDKEDEWILNTRLMRLVRYPIGWPQLLYPFQQIVGCSLVMRGRTDPLDWESPSTGALSSKEIPAILDPHWLINLVKGVGEEQKIPKGQLMLSYIAVGASVIAVIMLFYLITRI